MRLTTCLVFRSFSFVLQIFSEPAAAEKQVINGVPITIWDRWEIRGQKSTTLADFLAEVEGRVRGPIRCRPASVLNGCNAHAPVSVQEKYGIKPTGVFDNAVIIYMPGLPAFEKKLKKK